MTNTLNLDLEGMTCASCVARVERAVGALPGVVAVSANLGTEQVSVEYAAPAVMTDIVAALARTGYPVKEHHITLAVDGMTCAACTGRVERVLRAQPGVAGAAANLVTRAATVTLYTSGDPDALAAAVTQAGFKASPQQSATDPAITSPDADLWRAALFSALLTFPVFVVEMGGHLFPAFHHALHDLIPRQYLWLGQAVLITLVLIGPGRSFFKKGLPALFRFAPDMNSLVALGAGAAWAYSIVVTLRPGLFPPSSQVVYFEAAGVIVTLILIGRSLEARARGQAGAAIARLVALRPRTARRLSPDPQDVPIAALMVGDRVQLRPGEKVPADGIVVEGHSTIDESMLTGEALPQMKTPGNAVTGGTVNGTGSLVLQVTTIGVDSTLSRIISLVSQAQGGKLPVQALVDKITLWFVPAVMAVALVTFLAWLAFGPGLGQAVIAAVSVLIIACPCAMGLATPVSILVGSGRAAELGIVFRKGEAMQRLENAARVAFDKTGTLTMGKPVVEGVFATDPTQMNHLIALAAAVEQGAEHPLAQAILNKAAEQSMVLPPATDFAAHPGKGASAIIDGAKVQVGSPRLFTQVPPALAEIMAAAQSTGKGAVLVGRGDLAEALFVVADPVKATSQSAILRLNNMGLSAAMITGDAAPTAAALATQLNIPTVHAGVLPADKASLVAGLGQGTVFVGDGLNDAPALAIAEVGIAMGNGTDVAIEAGDVILMRADPAAVADAIALSKAVMTNIRQNLFWAFGYNIVLIPIAAGTLVPFGGPALSPMLAAGAMALSSVFVLGNALRLRFFRP
jgi:P-type Cu+ transporter